MIVTTGQIEEISHLTPLGLRFWDTLSGNLVGEGLTVTVYPSGDSSRQTKAISNRSGIYLAQNLPGLSEIEYGETDTDFWSNVTKKPFVVQVIDRQGRFQAFTFQIDLPYRGLFTDLCCSRT